MRREVELMTWLGGGVARSRPRRRDRGPRESREIARRVRQAEERRLWGESP